MEKDIVIDSAEVDFGDAHFVLYHILDHSVPAKNAQITLSSLFHSHLRWELHAAYSGSITIHFQEKIVELACGEMLLIPPDTEHHTVKNTPDTVDAVVAMTLARTDGEAGFYDYFSRTMCDFAMLPVKLPEDLTERLRDYGSTWEDRGIRSVCGRKAAAYDIVVRLFDRFNGFSAGETQIPRGEQQLSIRLQTLVERIDYPLASIAEDLGYSARHTLRLIQKQYGKNLNEIRAERMLNSAKKMLLEAPELTLGDIAERAGFSGTAAMRRAFQKKCRCSPLQFRNRGGEE